MKLKIIFFGSGGYTIPIIEELRDHGLQFVLTTEREGELVSYLKKEKIPYLSTHLKNAEGLKEIKKIKPDLGILASFGAILPGKIIELFPLGILNIHPSLLPKYKGPSPIQSTLLAGESETGITVIKLDNQVDHGPIVMQEKVQLTGAETMQALKKALFHIGSFMIGTIVERLENGEELKFTKQNHTKETFTKKIERGDGEISLTKLPHAEQLDRMVRAYYPWPGVWVRWQMADGRFKIVKILPEGRIQVEGKKPMTYKEFINGYQKEGKELLEKLKLL